MGLQLVTELDISGIRRFAAARLGFLAWEMDIAKFAFRSPNPITHFLRLESSLSQIAESFVFSSSRSAWYFSIACLIAWPTIVHFFPSFFGLVRCHARRKDRSVALPFIERLHFRRRLWYCGGVLEWIFILLAIVGIELCVTDAFVFPKAAHALFVFIEDFVEFVGLPSRKPFNRVLLRCTTFYTRGKEYAERMRAVNRKKQNARNSLYLNSLAG